VVIVLKKWQKKDSKEVGRFYLKGFFYTKQKSTFTHTRVNISFLSLSGTIKSERERK